VRILVPVDLAEYIGVVRARTGIVELVARGEALLAHLEDGADPLAAALGDKLFYQARLAMAQHDLRRISDEVWDLDEAVNGQRSARPPTDLANRLVPLVELELGDQVDVAAEQYVLESLCYGLGSLEADDEECTGNDRVSLMADAHAAFAAAKFALFQCRQDEQILGFNRAGLRGSLELDKRDATMRRKPPSSDAGG
jgi:hypothetical protein